MKYDEINIGDYIESQGHNPHGDRNLDGRIIRGIVVEKTDSHKQIQLHTGWCAHPEMVCSVCGEMKDKILRYIAVEDVAAIAKAEKEG